MLITVTVFVIAVDDVKIIYNFSFIHSFIFPFFPSFGSLRSLKLRLIWVGVFFLFNEFLLLFYILFYFKLGLVGVGFQWDGTKGFSIPNTFLKIH
jgi:hypothetical protein